MTKNIFSTNIAKIKSSDYLIDYNRSRSVSLKIIKFSCDACLGRRKTNYLIFRITRTSKDYMKLGNKIKDLYRNYLVLR